MPTIRPALLVIASCLSCAASSKPSTTLSDCPEGHVRVEDRCRPKVEGTRRIAYFYGFGNRRGLYTVNFDSSHEITSQAGSSAQCEKGETRAACEVSPVGKLRAVNDDCRAAPVAGPWVDDGCSIADAEHASDDEIIRTSCCLLDEKATEYPEHPSCACRPWAEVASYEIAGKCENGAECAQKLGLTDQCADPRELGQPWCFVSSECPEGSYEPEFGQWYRRCM